MAPLGRRPARTWGLACPALPASLRGVLGAERLAGNKAAMILAAACGAVIVSVTHAGHCTEQQNGLGAQAFTHQGCCQSGLPCISIL